MASTEEFVLPFLSKKEFDSIPEIVRTKVEKSWKLQEGELGDVRADYERLRVNSEQQCFELEKQVVETRSKLESETAQLEHVKQKSSELETKHTDSQSKLILLEDTANKTSSDLNRLKVDVDNLTSERNSLSELLEKRNKEIDRINQEWKSLSDQLVAANNAKCEALVKAEDVQSKELSLEYREKRINQEKELLNKQMEVLNVELKKKNNELLEVRRENSSKLLTLQAELGEKVEELQITKEINENQGKSMKEQASKLEDLVQRLKETRDSEARMEENYRQELRAQTRLADLYKGSNEESQAKSEELTSAVVELQKLLKEASEQYGNLSKKSQASEQAFKQQLAQKDEAVEMLKKELESANNLINTIKKKGLTDEGIESLSPSAAAASKMLKSGMTLTQIYSQYVSVSEELFLEKGENKRLNQYLDQILQEIEERSPILKKQRKDYEKSLETISALTQQLDNAMVDYENIRVEADDTRRKFGQLTRDNERLKSQTADLGQQVRVLLKEVEDVRGRAGVGTTTADEKEVSSADVSSSSQVISQRLVVFKNIEELQQQNQHLLAVVRDLSQKQETAENEAVEKKTVEVKAELEKAMQELDDLRSARVRQEQMVESIIRQRDMYKVLSQQAGSSPIKASPGAISSSTPAHTPSPKVKQSLIEKESRLNEAQAALSQMQQEFDSYKKEKAENDKILNEQLEKLRGELTEARSEAAKLASQAEYNSERFKILQSNADSYKRQVTALEAKTKSYSITVAKHEQTINMLKNESMSAQQKLSQVEVSAENLRQECAIFKEAESRLLAQKDMMEKEKRNQGLVLSNLEAIKNNLERSKSAAQMKMENQVDSLQKECSLLRKKVDQENVRFKEAVKAWEKGTKEMREKVEGEKQKHKKTQDELVDAYATVHRLKQDLSGTEEKLKLAEEKIAVSSQPVYPSLLASSTAAKESQLKDLRVQLLDTQNEVKSLKQQLTLAKQHSEQFKNIASSMEKQLKENNETSKLYKNSVEKRLQDSQEIQKKMELQIKTLEKVKKELEDEKKRISAETVSKDSDIKKQLEMIQAELKAAADKTNDALKAADEAKKESQEEAKLGKEAQEKYERELIQHAADVETLTNMKKDIEKYSTRQAELEQAKKKAEDTLQENQSGWESREKLLKTEYEVVKEQLKNIQSENSTLHEQLKTVTTQMKSLQTVQTQDPKSLNVSFSEEEAKSSEQLMEIIKYLRRERDITSSKFEVSETEIVRLKSQLEGVTKQLEEAQQTLQQEKQKSETSLLTASKHAELLRKIESMNAMNDSNRLLRQEKEALEKDNKELQEKVSKLEKEIGPVLSLQKQNKELTSKVDLVSTENQAIRAEVQRWKQRTNMLVEKANKSTPEDIKKLQQEKENLQKQIESLQKQLENSQKQAENIQKQLTQAQEESKRQLSQAQEEIKKQVSVVQQEGKRQLGQSQEESRKHLLEVNRLNSQIRNMQQQIQNASALQQQIAQDKKTHQEEITKLNQQMADSQKIHQDEVAKLNQQVSVIQHELNNAKIVSQKKIEESAKVTEYVEAKERALTDAKKNLLQVKGIARKYKNQYEKLKSVHDAWVEENKQQEMKKMPVGGAGETSNIDAARQEGREEAKKELETLQKEGEQKLQSLNEQIIKITEENEELKKENEGLKFTSSDKEERAKQVLKTARQKISQLTEQKTTLAKEREEMRARMERLEMSSEEGNVRLAALKSQYDGKIQRLEKEKNDLLESQEALQALQKEKESLTKELEALTQRLNQQQRQIENYQKQLSQQQVTKSTTTASHAEKVVTEPPTANIKPMAGPVTAPQKHAHQQQMSQNIHISTSRTTPTASIRPMAMQTRTATVLPSSQSAGQLQTSAGQTLVSQTQITHSSPQTPLQHSESQQTVCDSVPSTSSTSSLPQATVQPTPAVLPNSAVTVTITPTTSQDDHRMVQREEETPSVTITPMPSQAQAKEIASQITMEHPAVTVHIVDAPTQDTPEIVQPQTVAMVSPRVEQQQAEQRPTTSSEPLTSAAGTAVAPILKRQRDSEVDPGTEPSDAQQVKRTRTSSGTFEISESAEGEEQQVPVTQHQQILPQKQVPAVQRHVSPTRQQLPTVKPAFKTAAVHVATPTTEHKAEEDDNDVIVLEDTSEDEGQNDDLDDTPEEVYGEDMDDEEEEDDETIPEEGFEEEEDLEGDDQDIENFDETEGMDEDEGGQGGECEVEIIDPDAETTSDESQAAETSQQGSVEVTPSSGAAATGEQQQVAEQSQSSRQMVMNRPPLLPRVPGRTERLSSIGRQQLTPFDQSHNPQFDEGDDSIVPSTPTLFVPQRSDSDGFAEAVNSPQVPQGRFVFGSNPDLAAPTTSQSVGLAQLASQGMDATRMDLSQFDEGGTGRSVPTTPLQISPPAEPSPTELQPEIIQTAAISEAAGSTVVDPAALSRGDIPSITVTSPEKEEIPVSVEETHEVGPDGVKVEEHQGAECRTETSAEQQGEKQLDESAEIIEEGTEAVEAIHESSPAAAETAECSQEEGEQVAGGENINLEKRPGQESFQPRIIRPGAQVRPKTSVKPKPIVWSEPGPSGAGSPAAATMQRGRGQSGRPIQRIQLSNRPIPQEAQRGRFLQQQRARRARGMPRGAYRGGQFHQNF